MELELGVKGRISAGEKGEVVMGIFQGKASVENKLPSFIWCLCGRGRLEM